MRCALTAKPIDMPFWMKTRVGTENHVLDGGPDPSRGRGIFGVCDAVYVSGGLFNQENRFL